MHCAVRRAFHRGASRDVPEKSMFFLALFWALEWNQNIFSSHKTSG